MSRRHRGRKPNIAGEDPAQSGGAPAPEGERARDWDLQRIQSEYGLSRAMVRKYFPKPRQISRRNRAGRRDLTSRGIQRSGAAVLLNPEVQFREFDLQFLRRRAVKAVPDGEELIGSEFHFRHFPRPAHFPFRSR